MRRREPATKQAAAMRVVAISPSSSPARLNGAAGRPVDASAEPSKPATPPAPVSSGAEPAIPAAGDHPLSDSAAGSRVPRPQAAFLAHLIATRAGAAQTRQRRRIEQAEAHALYAKSATAMTVPPATPLRSL